MNQSWKKYLSELSLNSVQPNAELPNLYLCPLINNGLVSLEGEQSQQYLQGQLTCDMQHLSADNFLNGAHCDAKGKMWAIVKTFTIASQYLLCGGQAEINASIEQLQKYGVFAKTTISDASEQWLTLGVGGDNAPQWFAKQWSIDVSDGNTAWDIAPGKVIKIAQQRFILVLENSQIGALLEQHQTHLFCAGLWRAMDIQAGIAHLDETSINQYVPQMLNLHCLDAISFDKGCYNGQEMVARMKYLGKNKRATFILSGHASVMPQTGDDIQLAIGENWRRGGTIINIAGCAEQFHLLAVLANDTDADSQFRVKDDADSHLTLCQLPYSLESE